MYAVHMGGMKNSYGKCSQRIRREDTVDKSLARDKIIHVFLIFSSTEQAPQKIFIS